MTDIIRETDEDGEEYEFDLAVCDAAAKEVLTTLFEKENVVEHFDFTAAVYSIFISSIIILSDAGWSSEELNKIITFHSDQQGTRH